MAPSLAHALFARHGDGSSSSMGSMSMGSMEDESGCTTHMLGNWQTVGICVLTPSWRIENAAMFAGTWLGVFLLVVLIELLRRAARDWDRFLVRHQAAAQECLLAAAAAAASAASDSKTTQKQQHQPNEAQDAAADTEKDAALLSASASSSSAASSLKAGALPYHPASAGFVPASGAPPAPAVLDRLFYGLPSSALSASPCCGPTLRGLGGPGAGRMRMRASPWQRAVRSLLYAAQLAGAYIVMLVAMSFNGYLLIAIVLGGLVGHFAATGDAFEGVQVGSPGALQAAPAARGDESAMLTGGGGGGAAPAPTAPPAQPAPAAPCCRARAPAAPPSDQACFASGACC